MLDFPYSQADKIAKLVPNDFQIVFFAGADAQTQDCGLRYPFALDADITIDAAGAWQDGIREDDTYAQILKVVPIPSNIRGKYVTVEFESLEYISLQNSKLQELDFSLKSLSGSSINFIRNEFSEVYINLMLKKF